MREISAVLNRDHHDLLNARLAQLRADAWGGLAISSEGLPSLLYGSGRTPTRALNPSR